MVKIKIESEALAEEESNSRILKSVFFIIGIPLFWLIVFAFFKRKRSICIQKYGIDDCKKSPLGQLFLVIAIFLNLYAILRIKFYRNHYVQSQ